MRKIESEKPRLGISACLLGDRVRWDGGGTRDPFLADTLGAFVEWVPVCPEVEIGLGAPRPPIRLVGSPRAPRLVGAETGEDLTRRMRRFADDKAGELLARGLDGYVFKSRSPSCGLFRVPVYADGGNGRPLGQGLYARTILDRLPLIPVEEEGRLQHPAIREHFMERVFAAARWRRFRAGHPRGRDLVGFHAAHKYAVLAHSPRHYMRLGRLMAGAGPRLTRPALENYGALLMEALAVPATRPRQANVLQHIAGFFKRRLGADARAGLVETIEDYRRGLTPLAAPLALVRHHVGRLDVPYLAAQVYLDPGLEEILRACSAAASPDLTQSAMPTPR